MESLWMGDGGYGPIAEPLFNRADVDDSRGRKSVRDSNSEQSRLAPLETAGSAEVPPKGIADDGEHQSHGH
jgi:hypothetical protein